MSTAIILICINIATIVLIVYCANKSDEQHGDQAQGWAMSAIFIAVILGLFDCIVLLVAVIRYFLEK